MAGQYEDEDIGGGSPSPGAKNDSSILAQLVDFIGGVFKKVSSSGLSDILIFGTPIMFLAISAFGGAETILTGISSVADGQFEFLDLVLAVLKLLAVAGFGFALYKTLSKGATSLVTTLANIKGGQSGDGAKFFLYLTFFILLVIVAYGAMKTGEALNSSLSIASTALASGTVQDIIKGVIQNIGIQTFTLILYCWFMGYVFGTVLKNLDQTEGGLDKQSMVFSIAFSMMLMLIFVVAAPTMLNNWVKSAGGGVGIQGGILEDITGSAGGSSNISGNDTAGLDVPVSPSEGFAQ